MYGIFFITLNNLGERPWRTTLEKNLKSFETVVMERMTDVVKKASAIEQIF